MGCAAIGEHATDLGAEPRAIARVLAMFLFCLSHHQINDASMVYVAGRGATHIGIKRFFHFLHLTFARGFSEMSPRRYVAYRYDVKQGSHAARRGDLE
jgi:hypothetical protein